MAKKQPQSRTDAERRVRQCERLGRLLRTLQLIMGKGRWDADGLAQELECSRRTVYRMLQTLSMAGVPWYFEESCRAYRVRPGFRFPVVEPSGSSSQESLSSKSRSTIERLISDGEVVAATLEQFLKTLREVQEG